MSTAYQHRPLSKILLPQADSQGTPTTPDKEEGAGGDREIPEKYRGKSLEDVIEMHRNAERRIGALSNELGTMRGIVTDLSRITRQPTEPKTSVEDDVDLTGDELIADPVKAIRKVVKRDIERTELDRREAELQTQVQLETTRLLNDFGDIAAITQTEEFQEFATRTASRREDFHTAAYGEGMAQVRAARRLLEDYTDYKELVSKQNERQEERNTSVKAARQASTEGGGNAGRVTSKPVYKESEVLQVIEKEPEKWRSPSYQAEIIKAIKEGRYIKNA
jgi:Arc/MetJ family transcription regulator